MGLGINDSSSSSGEEILNQVMGATTNYTEYHGSVDISNCGMLSNDTNDPFPVKYNLLPIYELFNDTEVKSQWNTMYKNILTGMKNAAATQCSGQGTILMATTYTLSNCLEPLMSNQIPSGCVSTCICNEGWSGDSCD